MYVASVPFEDGKDDIAGPISLGIIMTFISIVIATATAMFERIFQNAQIK